MRTERAALQNFRTRGLAAVIVASVLAWAVVASPGVDAQTTQSTIGLQRLVAAYKATALTRAVVTFSRTPTSTETLALQQLGLAVQPMKHVPLAIVYGPVSAMKAAVTAGIAMDVYPDERIELFNTASSDAMGAAGLRAAGWTGKGVTVAVVDSGCDASHPDLADHVVHNVKLYSGEYATVDPDGTNTIVVPVELGPYQNSDIGSGHGTHVTGIIGADSTTAADGSRFGVAPDAELVCYSIGEVLFTSAVVTAYDHLLDQPDLWSVDVINNSWGNSFRQFDPRDPVAIVTRSVASLGVTVVFASGNSGGSNAEMGLSPYSQSPWVISVASSTIQKVRASSSSSGLMYDNSEAVEIGVGGHNVFKGDRIGIYHPDVTAPGASISSTCSSAGTVIGPCAPGDNATAGGTSMAAPHVAGAVALLLQANPSLSSTQVRKALQTTAVPVLRADGTRAPFWQAGFGFVSLNKALRAVRSPNYEAELSAAQVAADARVRAEDNFSVVRSDFWTYDAPRAAAAGSDKRTYTVTVPTGTSRVKATLSHPSLAVVGSNGMTYTVTVRDAAGRVLGTSTEAASGAGTASILLDLSPTNVTFGRFSFDVSGVSAASDPDSIDSESLLGRMVTLQVTQMKKS